MPRIKIAERGEDAQPATWQEQITARVRVGKLVPLISAAVGNDLVLGGQDALEEKYAKYSDYTTLDQRGLPHVAQVRSLIVERLADPLAIKEDYINFIKNHLFDLAIADNVPKEDRDEVEHKFDELTFSDFCTQLGYPRFESDHSNPLMILASFPLPIYLTTGYHNFMEVALKFAGKQPRTEFSRWHGDLVRIPTVFDGVYVPTKNEPLVYHLHGYDAHPASLVLTEDHHLKFLVDCSRDVGRDTDPIHIRVREAVSASSLMVLGYDLRSWEFRSILWGLIRRRSQSLTSVTSIQLQPSEIEKRYLDRYLGSEEIQFKVYWGSVKEYLQSVAKAVNNG